MVGGRTGGLVLSLSILCVSGGASAQVIPEEQRQALIDLYQTTGGPSWNDREGWLGSPGSECLWAGVECDPDLNVVDGLSLTENNLNGPLPGSLGTITSLRRLHLGGNHLFGPLPADLSGLSNLQELDVSRNALVGEVASTFLPMFTGISSLALDYNGLYAANATLADLIETKDPGWQTTQTVAPKGLAAAGATPTSITLRWNPIAYSFGVGFYRVLIATRHGGPYTAAGTTQSKSDAQLTVSQLAPATTYFFVVETVSLKTIDNQNDVTSEPGAELAAATAGNLPGAAVSGGGSICAGGSAQITAALTGAPPWTVTWSDGVVQANLTSSPLTRTVSPSATTTYSVTSVTNAAGSGTGTGSAVVTVNPIPPVPTITAPASLSPGQAGAASVESHAGSVYAWTIANGTLTSPATGSSIGFTAGPSGTVTLSVSETSAAGCTSTLATRGVTISESCAAPGAPVLSSTSTSYTSGQSALVSWSPASGLDAGAVYLLETSRDGFATLESSSTTSATFALLPTEPAAQGFALSLRVRARKACGREGASSNVLALTFAAAPASFLLTREGPSWTAQLGDPPPSAVVSYRNVGALPGRLTIFTTGDFFSISTALLDLGPGQEGSVTLTALPTALRTPGTNAALIVATSAGQSLPTPVSLAVGRAVDVRVRASTGSLTFDAPAGQTPAEQRVTITVTSEGSDPVVVAQDVGPGGSWLSVSGLEQPIAPGASMTLTLRVDRARRSFWDGPSPLRTVLRLTPVGADPETDSAVIEVVDVETITVVNGDDRGGAAAGRAPLAAPPGGTSFLIPTAVKAVSGLTGQRFSTDTWLRNISGAPVPATLYFTPDGKDGLSDPAVRKATVTVPGGQTVRLTDLLGTAFHLDGTSGQVEVRSASPQVLSVRTTVDSVLADGNPATRFGTEMPTVAYGAGVGLGGGELAVPGIDDDALNRANLILAETTGAAAFAKVTLYGPDGETLGSREYGVPPYGKIQENRIVDKVVPGRALSGGWLGVTVTAGSGHLVAVATVIDNSSGSFSAVLGRAIPPAGAAAREPQADSGTYIIPSVARTVGLNQTLFKTRLDLVNQTATPVALSLSYLYVDQDDGGTVKRQTVPLTLPGRGALPKAKASDVLAALFGVYNRSYGSILVEGQVSRVTAVAGVSSQVDPLDASKGFKTAQVNGVLLDAPEFLVKGGEERRVPNVEKSDYRRTNLVLVEVAGRPCEVEVRARTGAGQPAGTRVFGVGRNEYRQLNQAELFGPDGLGLGDATFQNLELSARLVSGDCRVLGLATVIDNLSRNPEIFLLQPAAPPAGGSGSIGF